MPTTSASSCSSRRRRAEVTTSSYESKARADANANRSRGRSLLSLMSGFESLHPILQHHIVNTLGWRQLHPLQEAAIEPVLAGESALLLAPTAGGKTEAA